MRNKDFTKRGSHDMLEQKDLDAAHTLMDMAKDAGWVNPVLPKAITKKNKNLKRKFSSVTSVFDLGFSIIHFLSAVRVALTTPVAEDFTLAPRRPVLEVENSEKGGPKSCLCMDIIGKNAAGNIIFQPHENHSCINASKRAKKKLPSLSTQEIVQLVQASPGDARILELNVPIQDLVRGVLRIFSSTTAPHGIPSLQPLTVYEKSSKKWSWVGPIPSHFPHGDHISTSPKAWGLRNQYVNELVDCFAEWLRSSRDILQKICSLPPPPLVLMIPTISSTERLNSTRNLKISMCTIRRSCEQVRAYFRMEEALRYLIPGKSFCYTAIDGKKSSVAPLRRCSGKPSRKARDHFILKPNRPPCFTVLCLVRDAAARLPDAMGTRSDICTLVRDSEFIIEDTADDQVEQVVSGALDRLHYEFDPCVRFDRDSRLWFYMHGNREEEDFEDYATSSTKIRKKVKLQNFGDVRRQHS
ncbi:hypothetical protein ACH5RR_005395 [Cinchona calisaya]|uniref:Nuclear factor related to kappa-B-binding protein second winged helix domain-containing protein n=1 Tax=Cinchona calisaya TaxID=153742 RepID=A0ABD3AL99_9GENT